MSVAIYIAVMAVTTYLVRMIPFAAVKGKIRSQFVQSLLYYIPYAVLSAMTIPAIFYSTGSMATAVVGTIAAVIMAYFGCPLIVVAMGASAAAFIAGLFM